MGDPYLLWAIICLAIALILFVIELFVPSGGFLGFCAAAALITGIVLLFKVDTTIGLVGAIVCLLAVPFLMAVAVNLWPNTPIARLLTLKHRQKAQTMTEEPAPAADQKLVGKTGKALTDLRPVGTCLIDGQRTECLAESGIIRAGAVVRVVLVDGLQVKVREET